MSAQQDQLSWSGAILLCTMQGAAFLEEQLASIEAQTVSAWTLWASDDGSEDTTLDILESYKHKWGPDRLTVVKGPGCGFAPNFLALVTRSTIQADWYAYADQDDVWEPDKLKRALDWLATVPSDMPALYCGRTRLIAENGAAAGFSPLFRHSPGFANALTQSIGGGNTMLFNHAARLLLLEAGGMVDVVSHDWWTYLLVSGCGGVVFYDPCPMVRYRQHGDNQTGCNKGWVARISRLRLLFDGRFKAWNDRHLKALQGMRHRMTAENLRILDTFAGARQGSLIDRLEGVLRAGLYRQTFMGNLGLFLAASTGKI